MLVAIFRSNKDAFINNNMHRLKAGKILNIPDREAVAAVDGGRTQDHLGTYRGLQRLSPEAGGCGSRFGGTRQGGGRQASGHRQDRREGRGQGAGAGRDQRPAEGDPRPSRQGRVRRRARLPRSRKTWLPRRRRSRKRSRARPIWRRTSRNLQKLVELKNQNLAELQKQAQPRRHRRRNRQPRPRQGQTRRNRRWPQRLPAENRPSRPSPPKRLSGQAREAEKPPVADQGGRGAQAGGSTEACAQENASAATSARAGFLR
jgi:pilus assembly protein FimV